MKKWKMGALCIVGTILLCCLLRWLPGETSGGGEAFFEPRCLAEPHVHGEACYGDGGQLCCGYGDILVHTHGEICYDSGGDLRCSLPEVYVHDHSDSCYGPVEEVSNRVVLWKQVLTCGREEIQLHTHKADCFRDGAWVCGRWEIQAHSHSGACFASGEPDRSLGSWLGMDAVEITPWTKAALWQMAAAVWLLYLQKRWERALPEKEKSLPQL